MNTHNDAFTKGFAQETASTRPSTEHPPSTVPSQVPDFSDDAEIAAAQAEAKKARSDAERANARLRKCQAELQAELAACGDPVTDLVAYAQTGKSKVAEILERQMRTQAIRTTLEAIPQAIAHIGSELREVLHECNETVQTATRNAALMLYTKHFKEFEANYQKLASSKDIDAFHRAAAELSALAFKARMLGHLRGKFREWDDAGRHRSSELVRY